MKMLIRANLNNSGYKFFNKYADLCSSKTEEIAFCVNYDKGSQFRFFIIQVDALFQKKAMDALHQPMTLHQVSNILLLQCPESAFATSLNVDNVQTSENEGKL